MRYLVNVYQLSFTYHPYYKKLFKELVADGIDVFIFLKNANDQVLDKKVNLVGFDNYEDLIFKIEKIVKKSKQVYFNTFEEHSIKLINDIKAYFGQATTDFYEAFVDKSLQRKLLLKKFPEISVKYEKTSFDDLKNRSFSFSYPFVIKPVSSAQSRGVAIIYQDDDLEEYLLDYEKLVTNLGQAGYEYDEFIIEEFIDGQAWSVDYFVDEKGEFLLFPEVFLEFAFDLGINDFANISRVISADKNLDKSKLSNFVKKNIEALGIKNTFVHHEFKLSSDGKLKTIEINGRIGGFRLDMYDKTYHLNLLKAPFEKINTNLKLQNNYAIWAIYPSKEAMFKGLDENLVSKIKDLPSFESLKVIEKKKGTKIGLAKNGYSRVGFIRLLNKDLKQFKKDYNFLRQNYLDLVNLE